MIQKQNKEIMVTLFNEDCTTMGAKYIVNDLFNKRNDK